MIYPEWSAIKKKLGPPGSKGAPFIAENRGPHCCRLTL